MPSIELEAVFHNLLAANRGPDYSVVVTEATPDLSLIAATVSFTSGRTYCCAEPFCHVPRNLTRLIALAADRGIGLPKFVRVRWHFVVEAGARLECLRHLGLPLESEHYEFNAESPAQ